MRKAALHAIDGAFFDLLINIGLFETYERRRVQFAHVRHVVRVCVGVNGSAKDFRQLLTH